MDRKSRDLVMGKLYLKNKDYKMAEKSLVDYLNSNPEDFQALKMLAQVYENLNNHQKAFEFYERSYLVEPERKGTLLDICRLLLIDNSKLDQIDRKKWLRLAVQAFPTNPIVTSLRDTVPIETTATPSKINLDDALISKFERLEQRMTGIEEVLTRLTATLEKFELSAEVIKSSYESKKLEEPKVIEETKKVEVTRKIEEQKPFQFATINKPVELEKTNNFKAVNEPKNSIEPPQQVETPKKEFVFNSIGLANKLGETKITEEPKLFGSPIWTKPPEPTTNIFSEQKKPEETTKSDSSSLFQPQLSQPIFTSLSNNFSFGSGGGGNLFADGLKKFNLPTEGPWASMPKEPAASKAAPKDNEERDEEDNNDDGGETVDAPDLLIENTCDMKPIEIKSGEEDEDIIFEHRCKLFRFRDKEYKERGLGNIKVLKHRSTGAGRLIMRRELINLVCLNCWSCSKVERVRDTQVRFAGLDASDGEAVLTVFLAKFKTQELTDTFMSHLKELFPDES